MPEPPRAERLELGASWTLFEAESTGCVHAIPTLLYPSTPPNTHTSLSPLLLGVHSFNKYLLNAHYVLL